MSRGSLLTGVKSDAVRAMQQLKVELSCVRFHVKDALSSPPKDGVTSVANTSARCVELPVETSSSTFVNSVCLTAFGTDVAPAAVIEAAGTNTARLPSLSS